MLDDFTTPDLTDVPVDDDAEPANADVKHKATADEVDAELEENA